jgi:DNA topoisomerase-3
MADGSENIDDFLAQQTRFTTDICKAAINTNIALSGAHICPECEQGVLQRKNGVNGEFWGCSRYPLCRATYNDNNGEPEQPKHKCPRCKKGALKLKNGKNGPFWGCTRFPECRTTFNDKAGSPDIPLNPASKTAAQ